MSRKPLIAGNWKLNNNARETISFIKDFSSRFDVGCDSKNQSEHIDIIIMPPFTSLHAANDAIREFYLTKQKKISLGAQDLCQFKEGAYTGEVSAEMLVEIGVETVLVGHSERRQIFREDNDTVKAKMLRAWDAGLSVIFCCGEPIEVRNQHKTDEWIATQIDHAMQGLKQDSNIEHKLVIAYEPIWAIGTGQTCEAQEANRVIKFIRNRLKNIFSNTCASQIRILYGGSVKAATIEEQMKQSDIDGALVGGASLKASEFSQIVSLFFNGFVVSQKA